MHIAATEKQFVYADEKLTVFVNLESVICASSELC